MGRSFRTRRFWFWATAWRRRLVFCGGALLVGLMGVGFALSADWVQGWATRGYTAYPLALLIVSPTLFAFSAWMALRYFPGSQGSGIPQVIAARHLRYDPHRQGLLSPKVAIGKIVLTMVGLAAGASIGREGPTVQVGATIMLACAGIAGLKGEKGFVLAGSAAGIAAAFNTPLAGVVFAIEEMARAYEHRTSGLVLVAVIIAGIASIATLGNYAYFGRSSVSLGLLNGALPVLAAGAAGGLMGGVFSRLVLEAGSLVPRLIAKHLVRGHLIFAALCGLIVAVIGLLSHGDTLGTGYAVARGTIEGTTHPAWWYAFGKLLTTAASTLSGIPGGLFAPSLSVGAAIGSTLSSLFPTTPSDAVVMLGMVAYFAGVTHAPITGFVIVMEMTGDHNMVVPLMGATVLGLAASRLICRDPIYHAMARQIVHATRAAAALKRKAEADAQQTTLEEASSPETKETRPPAPEQ